MSENTPADVPASALGPLRTLAVRITDGLRAQLDVLAQLNDRTVTFDDDGRFDTLLVDKQGDGKVDRGFRIDDQGALKDAVQQGLIVFHEDFGLGGAQIKTAFQHPVGVPGGGELGGRELQGGVEGELDWHCGLLSG